MADGILIRQHCPANEEKVNGGKWFLYHIKCRLVGAACPPRNQNVLPADCRFMAQFSGLDIDRAVRWCFVLHIQRTRVRPKPQPPTIGEDMSFFQAPKSHDLKLAIGRCRA